MSAKVNMEALPKEPDRTPLDPCSSSPSEAVLICGSDGVAKKTRPQPHTTTAFLLPGGHRSGGGGGGGDHIHGDPSYDVFLRYIV